VEKSKNKIKKIFFKNVLVLSIIAAAVFFMPVLALAAEGDQFGQGYAANIGLSDTDPRIMAANAIRVMLGFLGLIAVVLIMYAGWVWMTSQGNMEKIEIAKKILKNAIVGLLIIFSSFGIVTFIINKFLDGSSGGRGSADGGSQKNYGGIGSLGYGVIQSVYPAPAQKDVPRNTGVIVTFREPIDPATICNVSGGASTTACDGDAIKQNSNKDNVRFFETARGDACEQGACSGNIAGVKASSVDNKTFVFTPAAPLGSPTESVWHSVRLSPAIRKANGKSAFQLSENGYEWSFQVNNLIDLTPPQVILTGVFPAPDNKRDVVGLVTAGVQATGSIEIIDNSKIKTQQNATAVINSGGTAGFKLSGAYNCKESGMINISIDSDGKITVSGISGVVGGDSVDDKIAAFGCGLLIVPEASADFAAGNAWAIAVAPAVAADILTVDGQTFVFGSGAGLVATGMDAAATAVNIRAAINAAGLKVAAAGTGAKIILTANAANAAGNEITFAAANKEAFTATPMAGGHNRVDHTEVKHKKDKPRNSAVQVNFNEPVNPMAVSGAAADVYNAIKIVNASSTAFASLTACAKDEDCLSYSCQNSVCVGDYLSGRFLVSNSYKTVEFLSNKVCGTNACGEKIYCLPESAHLRVELKAASLQICGAPADCAVKTPFINCNSGLCQDAGTPVKNYPSASLSAGLPDGITDAVFNSLDGNRDGNAAGPAGFYNENAPADGTGDNFSWSFFVNDKIETTPIFIRSTGIGHNATISNLTAPIEIVFRGDDGTVEGSDKLMMSSSLATGEIEIDNGKDKVRHKLINFWSAAQEPLGYWVTNENIDTAPADGEADWTKVYLNHSGLKETSRYRVQAGSGVKDVYQNCYKPAKGPACMTGVSQSSPSCCSGTASTADGVVNKCLES